jgi:hypothetical protein
MEITLPVLDCKHFDFQAKHGQPTRSSLAKTAPCNDNEYHTGFKAWLARTAARFELVEAGKVDIDEAFDGLVISLQRNCAAGASMHPIDSESVRRHEQLGKLVRLLASDKDGEVIAAAAAIKRTLASRDRDIHDLADAVDAGLQQRSISKANPLSRRTGFAKRPSAFHMGDRFVCDQLVGLFRRCRCGSENFTVIEGIGPHAAQLRCDCCGLGGRWLARHNFG